MSDPRVKTVADCTELRETILARPPRVVLACFVLAVLLLASGTVWAALAEVDLVIEVPGVVKAREFAVQSGADGEIEVVHFEVGQLVEEGDVLFELDTSVLEESLREVDGSIVTGAARMVTYESSRTILESEREAELVRVEREIRTANSNRTRAQLEVQAAELELERARGLVEDAEARVASHLPLLASGDVPASRVRDLKGELRDRQLDAKVVTRELDIARANLDSAEEGPERARDAGQSRLRALDARMRDLDIQIDEEQERLTALGYEMRALERDLERCTVRVPVTGTITDGEPRVGYTVFRGQQVATIAPEQRWVEGYVKNSDIAGVHLGQAVRIKIAPYDFREHGTADGELVYIAPDATAAGYLVKIQLASRFVGDPTRPIALGMMGKAELVTERQRVLALAFRGLRKKTELNP